jgi:Hemerythrin HHE cation binding domain
MQVDTHLSVNKIGNIDALSLLKNDHRIIEALLITFTATEDRRARKTAARRLCQVITIHMEIEESILYPVAQLAIAGDLVHEAEVEHFTAKVLIADIESLNVADARFAATVKVLGEYVRHHIKEEEHHLFPQLRRAQLDMSALGMRLAAARLELLATAGLDDSELACMVSNARGASSHGQATTARNAALTSMPRMPKRSGAIAKRRKHKSAASVIN